MKKLLLLMALLTACSTSTTLESNEGACAAPDSTYPQLTYETWENVEYGLPWCWTVEENQAASGPQLWITRAENLPGDYKTDVVFELSKFSVAPLVEMIDLEDRGTFLLGVDQVEAHLYFQDGGKSLEDSYTIEYGAGPYFFVSYDGDNFEDSEVQLILSSLTINE